MSWCDEHTCEGCPGQNPGGPCWDPDWSVEEDVQFVLDSVLADELDMEERQLLNP